MILAKSDSRYSGLRPRVEAMAFISSMSKPTIFPLGSLNSLGVSGNIHADDEFAGRLDVVGHRVGDGVHLRGVHGYRRDGRLCGVGVGRAPDRASTPLAAHTTATRPSRSRRSWLSARGPKRGCRGWGRGRFRGFTILLEAFRAAAGWPRESRMSSASH